MKTNRLAKIMGIGVLAVLLLPTLTQAQGGELIKAGSKAVSKTGFSAACKEAGCPLVKALEGSAGKIEKAVAEGTKAAKASAEIGKIVQATGMSEVKGVTTASKAARQAQEGVNGLRQPQARKVKAPATHYYSMPNKSEEVPSLTQKVPSSTPSPIEPQASVPETVSGEIEPQAPIPETVSGEPVVSQETLQVVEDTAAKSNPAVVSDAAPKTAETKRYKTAQEWVDEYYANGEPLKPGTSRYAVFRTKFQQVKKALEAGQEVDPGSLEMYKIYEKDTKRVASPKTAKEWVDEYYANGEPLKPGTPMYGAFKGKAKQVSKAQAVGQEVDPDSLEMYKIYKENTKRKKTPQEWLAEYRQHPEELKKGTPMYEAFTGKAKQVSKAQEAGKEVDDASLEMANIYWENTKRPKTVEEWLELYRQHPEELKPGTPMYNAFLRKSHHVKKAQEAGKEVDDASLAMANIYWENTRDRKTVEEWLTEYRQHPEELKRGTPMYGAFKSKAKQVSKAQEAGKEVDDASLEMANIYWENTRDRKTAQEWLVEYRQHPEELKPGTLIYNAFLRKSHHVKKAQEAGKEVDDASLEMANIYWGNTKRQKTAQEWLAEYRQHPEELKKGTPMYGAFRNKNLRVKKALEAGKEVDEASLKMAEIYAANTKRVSAMSTSEVYEMFLTYLKENKSYPLATSQEYQVVYKRLLGKTAEEIKADPDLYKLYRLDQLAQAARRGEKSWEVFEREDPLRRQRVGEKEKNYGVSVAEEKQLFNQLKGNYEHAWDNYSTWYNESKQYIVFTPQTQTAFKVIDREVAAGRESDELMELVDMLQKMELGYAENAFNRLIYRGNQSLLPRAEDFHLVAEEQGVPNLPNVKELFPQSVPHVAFKFSGGRMSVLGLTEGVTPQDVQTVIDGILEELNKKVQSDVKWTVRMGTHEIGDKPHIHFEFVDGEEGFDISYTLQLNVPERVIPMGYSWDNKARYNGFKKLFGNYMQ